MLNNARTCTDFKDDSDSWNEAICTWNEAIHSSSEAIRTSSEARYTLLYRKQTNKQTEATTKP